MQLFISLSDCAHRVHSSEFETRHCCHMIWLRVWRDPIPSILLWGRPSMTQTSSHHRCLSQKKNVSVRTECKGKGTYCITKKITWDHNRHLYSGTKKQSALLWWHTLWQNLFDKFNKGSLLSENQPLLCNTNIAHIVATLLCTCMHLEIWFCQCLWH